MLTKSCKLSLLLRYVNNYAIIDNCISIRAWIENKRVQFDSFIQRRLGTRWQSISCQICDLQHPFSYYMAYQLIFLSHTAGSNINTR